MKLLVLISTFLLSLSAMASYNCDIYLLLSEVDGRQDLTNKVLDKFESKGYKITRVESLTGIMEFGKVSYMTVFSDIHSSFGARTSINLVDLYTDEGFIISKTESKIAISKKPLFGSAEKSLLKSVEKSIPACSPRD